MDLEKLKEEMGIEGELKKCYCPECGCAIITNGDVKICSECEEGGEDE